MNNHWRLLLLLVPSTIAVVVAAAVGLRALFDEGQKGERVLRDAVRVSLRVRRVWPPGELELNDRAFALVLGPEKARTKIVCRLKERKILGLFIYILLTFTSKTAAAMFMVLLSKSNIYYITTLYRSNNSYSRSSSSNLINSTCNNISKKESSLSSSKTNINIILNNNIKKKSNIIISSRGNSNRNINTSSHLVFQILNLLIWKYALLSSPPPHEAEDTLTYVQITGETTVFCFENSHD